MEPVDMTITDQTRLTEMTVGEFKALVRAIVETVVQEAVFELEQQLPDPDEGLTVRPEVGERLQQSLMKNGELASIEDVRRELKLNE
jgi:hypothetical protein